MTRPYRSRAVADYAALLDEGVYLAVPNAAGARTPRHLFPFDGASVPSYGGVALVLTGSPAQRATALVLGVLLAWVD